MGAVSDWLFGGEDDSAQDSSLALQDEKLALFQKLAGEAKEDVIPLFGQADADRDLGLQAAMDALQGGQPQFQRAIMGQSSKAPQVSLPDFGGSAAVFPTRQAGFVPSIPEAQPLTLEQAAQQVFANPVGSAERQTADKRVTELLAGGEQSGDLFDAITAARGLEKGTTARDRARAKVKDLLPSSSGAPTSLNSIITSMLEGDFSDPAEVDINIDLSSLSTADLEQGIAMARGLGQIPGLSLPSWFTQFNLGQELAGRGTFGGADGGGFGGGLDEAGEVDGNVV